MLQIVISTILILYYSITLAYFASTVHSGDDTCAGDINVMHIFIITLHVFNIARCFITFLNQTHTTFVVNSMLSYIILWVSMTLCMYVAINNCFNSLRNNHTDSFGIFITSTCIEFHFFSITTLIFMKSFIDSKTNRTTKVLQQIIDDKMSQDLSYSSLDMNDKQVEFV